MAKTQKYFYYHKKIDKQVMTAVEKVLKVRVKKAVKMKHGEVNHVYKIVTEEGVFAVKVFKMKYWPEQDKLPWIERQMVKNKIPHAKILFYDRSSKYFPAGFMVSEFIDGTNGEVAVKSGQLSLSQAFEKIGRALAKIHTIKIKKYGQIRNGKGESTNFLETKLSKAKDSFEHLAAKKAADFNMFYRVKEAVAGVLEENKKMFTPVLVHRDASRENAIYGKDKQWYVIDWDNAKSGIWLEDYTELTFWTDWKRSDKVAKKRHEIIQKNFFKGYGQTGISQSKLLRIERALHILKCAEMMSYYYFNKKNLQEFKLVSKKLQQLLNINS